MSVASFQPPFFPLPDPPRSPPEGTNVLTSSRLHPTLTGLLPWGVGFFPFLSPILWARQLFSKATVFGTGFAPVRLIQHWWSEGLYRINPDLCTRTYSPLYFVCFCSLFDACNHGSHVLIARNFVLPLDFPVESCPCVAPPFTTRCVPILSHDNFCPKCWWLISHRLVPLLPDWLIGVLYLYTLTPPSTFSSGLFSLCLPSLWITYRSSAGPILHITLPFVCFWPLIHPPVKFFPPWSRVISIIPPFSLEGALIYNTPDILYSTHAAGYQFLYYFSYCYYCKFQSPFLLRTVPL